MDGRSKATLIHFKNFLTRETVKGFKPCWVGSCSKDEAVDMGYNLKTASRALPGQIILFFSLESVRPCPWSGLSLSCLLL